MNQTQTIDYKLAVLGKYEGQYLGIPFQINFTPKGYIAKINGGFEFFSSNWRETWAKVKYQIRLIKFVSI